eukprot:scaffold75381_cov37-Tisochrysis_lutea.AAC.2
MHATLGSWLLGGWMGVASLTPGHECRIIGKLADLHKLSCHLPLATKSAARHTIKNRNGQALLYAHALRHE